MSLRILWRSTVFIATILFIYLAFPILIVPSSLPAIKAIFIDQQYPETNKPQSQPTSNQPLADADAYIYELNIPTLLTATQKIQAVKQIHQQGMNLILARN
jgi:hypothetical protein